MVDRDCGVVGWTFAADELVLGCEFEELDVDVEGGEVDSTVDRGYGLSEVLFLSGREGIWGVGELPEGHGE